MDYAFDPELVPILEFLPTTSLEDPVATRAEFDAMIAQLNAELDDSGVRIENRTIPGAPGAPEVAVRIYTPQDLPGTVPGLLYLHGGGFVIGNLDTEHGNCLALCRDLGIVLVSVDYRLAPETPYPGRWKTVSHLAMGQRQQRALSIDATRLRYFRTKCRRRPVCSDCPAGRDRQGPADMLPVPRHPRGGRPTGHPQHAAALSTRPCGTGPTQN